MTALRIPDPAERDDLGAFVARVVRLDQTAMVRLRVHDDRVTAWARTPFDALATRAVHGALDGGDLAVSASSLLTALTVDRADRIEPGPPGPWADELPPTQGFERVDDVPATEVEALADRGLELARQNAGPLGPPASLLDQTVLTITAAGAGRPVKVPMRCLFALSGMGFLGEARGSVRVSATGTWLRLDARFGAVVRRRLTALPLLAR